MSFENLDVSNETVLSYFPSSPEGTFPKEDPSKITINHMNCSVINVPNVFICDVDVNQKDKGGYLSFFDGWFADKPDYWEDLQFRVYETFGGFRIFLLNDILFPNSTRSKLLMAAMGSDPLYAMICEHQGLYRARLTPKPVRVPVGELPENFAVTRKVSDYHFGEISIHPQVRKVLHIHDAWCINEDKPLA